MFRRLNHKVILISILLVVIIGDIPAIQSIFTYTRENISLNGEWNIIIDPYENGYYNYRWQPYDELNQPWASGYFGDIKSLNPGDLIEYDYDKSPVLNVPGDWNTQDSSLFFYEGTIWYRKKFDVPGTNGQKRVFVHFGGINYRADVYLNSKKLGTHTGGFTPFYFEITELLREKDNSLIIKVDNKRFKEGVPTLNTDWWNYGGIIRDVKLILVPNDFIRDYSVSFISSNEKKLNVTVFLEGLQKVRVLIPELKITAEALANTEGYAKISFPVKNLELWSPENPHLYRLEITAGNDKIIDSVGLRTIYVKEKKLFLNNEEVFLRGISIHDEYSVDGGGRINKPEEARQLLEWAKELGCNFVRLAHYPHHEEMVRMAERLGIMVWSEIPVYWTIDWQNEITLENARNQLEENILRDRNRACVIVWSIANETPVNDYRNQFLTNLSVFARQLDPSRLISAAMEKNYKSDSIAVIEDPLASIVDIISFNEYIGWYDGLPSKCKQVKWVIPYNKPVFVSEFGGDAKSGLHGEKNYRWTEEFQEDLYIKTLSMLDQIDGLCGMSPWILIDFRSPRRPLPDIQDYYNRKGLLSERGEKKKAFYILQSYYNDKSKSKIKQ